MARAFRRRHRLERVTRIALPTLVLAASAAAATIFSPAWHRTTHATSRTALRLAFPISSAPIGQVLADVYGKALPEIDVKLASPTGAVNVVKAIQRGDADLGFTFADVAYFAFRGEPDKMPLDQLRGVAVLPLAPIHLVVGAHSGIHDITELRGHRVGVGGAGTGTAVSVGIVLEAFGVDFSSFQPDPVALSAATARMLTGQLDAFFINGYYPLELVRNAAKAGVRLLPIEGAPVARLQRNYPFLRPMVIPASAYGEKQVRTLGVDGLLVCRRDLDEALTYNLTRIFFDALPTIAARQESMRSIDVERAPATPIPLHNGAARYYREQEILR